MNVDANRLFSGDPSGNFEMAPADESEFLSGEIREHQEIIQRSGRYTLTGRVALLSDPDPNYPGALQVWSKTAEGPWIWVSPDGEVIESACPIGD